MNNIKATSGLAVSAATTNIAFSSSFAADMSGNFITPISISSAQQATGYTPASSHPSLSSFAIDMNAGTIAIVFSETVVSSSLQPGQFRLQSSATNPAYTFGLTGTAIVTTGSTSTVVLQLSSTQLNTIKLHTNIAVSTATSYLSATASGVLNVYSLGLLAGTIGATTFTPDTTHPNFVGFNLNMDATPRLDITFDEPVNISSFAKTAITLQDAASSANAYQLSGGVTISTTDGTVVSMSLATLDSNSVKAVAICLTSSTCFARVGYLVANDMAGLPVNDIVDGNAIPVSTFVPDTTPVSLSQFVKLDKNNGQLTIKFTEPVNPSTIQYTQLALADYGTDAYAIVTMTGGSVSSSISTTIIVTLSVADLNTVKLTPTLCQRPTGTDCWIRISSSFIQDASGNSDVAVIDDPSVPRIDAALSVTLDITAPILQHFSIDMDTAQLALTFDEPIQPLTLVGTKLRLAGDSTGSIAYTLTGGSILTTALGTTVTLQISATDAIKIKATGVLAVSSATSYLSILSTAIKDIAGNFNSVVSNLAASSFNADITSPALVSFDSINTNLGTLLLSFSEPVYSDSILYSKITVYSAATSGVSLTLSGGTVAYTDTSTKLQILVTLTSSDLRVLKLTTGLAVSLSTSYVAIAASGISDMVGNAISNSARIQASLFVATVQPRLQSYSLNMNLGTISMTFDDVMSVATLKPISFTLQSSSSIVTGTKTYQLTGGSTASVDGFTIIISLTSTDLNAIKALRSLCSALTNTYLVVSSDGLLNYASVPMVSIISNSALRATSFVADTTSPVLSSFSFNQASGQLTLTFSETVDLTTLDVSQITLQNAATAAHSIVLTGVSVLETNTAVVVDIVLTTTQLNTILFGNYIASTRATTYLTFTNLTVHDIAGNAVTPVVDGTGLEAASYTASSVHPALSAFSLNMNTGVITLSFTRPVDPTTMDVTHVTLQNSHTPTVQIPLSGGQTSSTAPGVVLVQMNTNDMNLIKAGAQIATGTGNSFVRVDAGTILDYNSVPCDAVTVASAVQASSFIADTTSPVLASFSLNMNSLQISLTFSETVKATSFVVSDLTIQSSGNSSDVGEYKFAFVSGSTSSLTSSSPATVVILQLSAADGNSLKAMTVVATSRILSYLSGTGFIADMSNNVVFAILQGSALEATSFTPDTTQPTIASYSLDMSQNLLTLAFSETVKSSTLSTTGITIQASTSVSSSFTLTGGSLVSSTLTTATFGLLASDVNGIKLLGTGLALSAAKTYLSVSSSGITDMSGNALTDISSTAALAIAPGSYHGDTIQPTLDNYDLDLSVGTLQLVFSEPVLGSSLVLGGFTLQNQANSPSGFSLTGGSAPTGIALSIVIQLSQTDLNTIKYNGISLTSATSYLAAAVGSVVDTSALQLGAIPDTGALQVRYFTGDSISPSVSQFDLNMNNPTLIMTFSESVRAAAVNPAYFTLTSSSTSGASTVQHTLTGGSVTQIGQTVVAIALTTADMNALKLTSIIGFSASTTFLTFTGSAASDTSSNAVTPRSLIAGNALSVTTLTQDTTSPNVVSFNLDMDQSILDLSFDEPILSTSVVPSSIKLQNTASGASSSLQLTDGSVRSSSGLIISISLSSADVDALKLTIDLGKTQATTFLSILSTGATDMAGNSVTGIAATSAMQVSTYSPDVTRPTLVSFVFNMDAGKIVATFSEPVVASSVDFTKFKVVDTAPSSSSYILTGGTVTSSNGRVQTIVLSTIDVNALKLDGTLALSAVSSGLTVNANAVYDMAASANGLIPVTGAVPSQFIADITSPNLLSFSVNLNTGVLIFNFDEPVRASSLTASGFSAQQFANAASGVLVSLTGGGFSSTNGLQLTLQMSSSDINAIEALYPLYSSLANAYGSITSSFAKDMAGNGITSISSSTGLHASSYVKDSTHPSLQSFDLNLNTGVATLYFSKPINVSAIYIGGIAFQNGPSVTSTGTYSLTTSTVTTSIVSTTVHIAISSDDLVQLKLASIALTASTAYITATSSAFVDEFGNDLIAVSNNNNAILVNAFFRDSVSPTLLGFSLSMNDPVQLVLTYSEPVLASTLSVAGLTLANAGSTPSENVALSVGSSIVLSGDGSQQTISIGTQDANTIKDHALLAKSRASSYLSFTLGSVQDMSGNGISAVPLSSGIEASIYTADATDPTLTSFTLSMNGSPSLSLTFSEPMNVSSFNPQSFTIQSTSSSSVVSVTLGSLTVVASSSALHTVINVDLLLADSNAVKAVGTLAISKGSTYLSVLAGAVSDVSSNPVASVNTASAMNAASYTPDTTPPSLQSFDLNMNAGTVQLSFSETVKASTLSVTGLTLQDAAPSTKSFTLTTSTASSTNSDVVLVTLSTADLDSIKALYPLSSSKATSYLRINANTVYDMSAQGVVAIVNANAIQANSYTADATSPTLQHYSLNLNTGTLVLTFSETVDGSTLTTSAITLQSASNMNGLVAATHQYTLTGGSYSPQLSTVISVSLSTADLNAIKALPIIAITNSGTFLSLTSSAVKDVYGNAITVIASTAGQASSSFTPDATSPVLSSFDINMSLGTLTLSFSEPVDATSVSVTAITLQNAATLVYSANAFQLTSGSTSSAVDSMTIQVTLSAADLNSIKLIRPLARSRGSSFIVIASSLVKDTSANSVTPIIDGQAQEAASYTADTIAPTLQQFDLDMNTGILIMTFSEVMDITTLHRDYFLLQCAASSDGVNQFRLNP